MGVAFSAGWTSAEPFFRGLKFGGLMNQALEQDETYRQGRHHFMTAINQILEWGLALEQVSVCLQAANVNYSLTKWNIAQFVVPMGVAYLSSRQIEVLHISEAANFVQNHLGKLSLLAMAVSTIGLLILGHTFLAVTTLAYLTVGLLERQNVLPESAQKVLHYANFFIGNFTGLYLGGLFVRVICTLNLIVATVKKYFEHRLFNEEKAFQALERLKTDDGEDFQEGTEARKNQVSLNELQKLTHDTVCTMRQSHIQEKPLPSVDEKVQITDILDLADQVDWLQHEHVIKGKLAKDKRWLEVGQFEAEPIEYFQRNLKSLIESIRDRQILQGKPLNYEMLEFYCRFIAQELQNIHKKNEEECNEDIKKQNEITIADTLIWLGVEGGEYCGTGKFGIVEEVYENLLAQAEGLPLETRVLACEQQERQRIWQHIYQLVWTTNPITQAFGYFSEINAIHNANLFINLVQAGEKFGIPHQAAKNDQAATINPITHYLAFIFVNTIEKCFWKGHSMPQCYISIDKPQEEEWWKAWKWVQLKTETVDVKPYNEEAILTRLNETIGSPQIPKFDIYIWWQKWIYRQNYLSEDQQDELCGQLQEVPKTDSQGNRVLTFNGEPFEVNGKIQPKFLKVMLIEMGIFNKPSELSQDEENS